MSETTTQLLTEIRDELRTMNAARSQPKATAAKGEDGKKLTFEAAGEVEEIRPKNDFGWHEIVVGERKYATKKGSLLEDVHEGDNVTLTYIETQKGNFTNRYLESITVAPRKALTVPDLSDVPF